MIQCKRYARTMELRLLGCCCERIAAGVGHVMMWLLNVGLRTHDDADCR